MFTERTRLSIKTRLASAWWNSPLSKMHGQRWNHLVSSRGAEQRCTRLSLSSEWRSFHRAHNRRRLCASSLWETGKYRGLAERLGRCAIETVAKIRSPDSQGIIAHGVNYLLFAKGIFCSRQRKPMELKGLRGQRGSVSLCPIKWNPFSPKRAGTRNGLRGNKPQPWSLSSASLVWGCAPQMSNLTISV